MIQHVYAFLTSNGYAMTAAVFAVECKLDQSVLQVTPPGDDLETIVTNYCDHKIPTTSQIIIPPVKRTRKKNWIIMEPHASSVAIPTAINSFEHKRSHDPTSGYNSSNDTPPPKRLCTSPRKSGTPRKHNATPPMRSCDPVESNCQGAGVSNQEELQLLGNSDIVDMELLQSVINDTQLPQQLADSINAALQSVNGATVTTGGGSHDTVATSDDLVDKILENTQPDLLEFLTDLLPHSDSDND